MAQHFDYDPLLGTLERFEYDEHARKPIAIRMEQDVSGLLDKMHEHRATRDKDRGIKEEMWHYCSIPTVVQMELLKKGINLQKMDKGDWPKFFRIINSDYPWLKTTDKTHA